MNATVVTHKTSLLSNSIVSLFLSPPPSLIASAIFEEYNFPLSVETGIDYPIRLLLHNIGTSGIIAGGVTNETGNPSSFTINNVEELFINPGQYLRVASTSPVANCLSIDIIKKIRFNVAGTYTINLWAMHEEAGIWYVDREVPLVITVNQAGAVTKTITIFDNLKLKAEWYDTKKSITKSIININPALLTGGKLDYTVQYTQGTPLAEIAKINFDGTNIASVSLSKGEAKSGSIDLTGLIGNTASITISFESFPSMWSEILFDIDLILYYSEEPPIDPTATSDFLAQYGKLIALGTIGILALFMIRRPSIIVVGGK